MSGFISKIDGVNQNGDARVCFNCNNVGHMVKYCKALFCNRCHSFWKSLSDVNYHKSLKCPNYSENNMSRRQKNNKNNGKQRDRNDGSRRGRHALRGVVQGRTAIYPREQW